MAHRVRLGIGPRDQFGNNVGPHRPTDVAAQLLQAGPEQRTAWNVQRLYWFLWRDPAPGSLRAPVQHLRHRRAAALQPDREARLQHLQELHGRDDPARWRASPRGRAAPPATRPRPSAFPRTSPARPSSATSMPSPSSLRLAVHPGPPLSDGTHTFFVKAIDAPGNESAVRSRSFTVDTIAPAAPRITATDPGSPANNNPPKVKGSAAAGSTVRLYRTRAARALPVASGSATQFASPGLAATVADNTTTTFRATATDAAGNASACSSPAHLRRGLDRAADDDHRRAVGPTTNDATPTFTFTSSESGSTFQCRFDSEAFAACSGPGASHTRSTPLSQRLPQLRGPGHRPGEEHRRDARQAHLHGRPLIRKSGCRRAGRLGRAAATVAPVARAGDVVDNPAGRCGCASCAPRPTPTASWWRWRRPTGPARPGGKADREGRRQPAPRRAPPRVQQLRHESPAGGAGGRPPRTGDADPAARAAALRWTPNGSGLATGSSWSSGRSVRTTRR